MGHIDGKHRIARILMDQRTRKGMRTKLEYLRGGFGKEWVWRDQATQLLKDSRGHKAVPYAKFVARSKVPNSGADTARRHSVRRPVSPPSTGRKHAPYSQVVATPLNKLRRSQSSSSVLGKRQSLREV